MKKLEKGLKKINIKFNDKKIENIIETIKKTNLIMICSCIYLIIICSKFSRYIIYE